MMKDFSMLKKWIVLGVYLFGTAPACALTPFNLIRPFDPNFFPNHWEKQHGQFIPLLSGGLSGVQGRTATGQMVNPLQYLAATQDALAMLKGFAPTSPQAQLAQLINVNGDDGTRGHFTVTGDFDIVFSGQLSGWFYLPHGFWVGACLPLASMKVKNVTWVDQTQNYTLDDSLTHQYLTDQLATNVFELGDGLKIGNWYKEGVGDFTTYVGWRQRYLQEKPWLKEVMVNVRLGVQFPTGVVKDQDVAVAVAFGNDGAYTVPFGAGIDLRIKNICWAGVDVMFMKTFDHTRNRRIQTDPTQTNLLILEKTLARQEYGLTQMFNLYVEPKIYKGLSVRFAYEHFKHGDDNLFVISNDFSSYLADTAAVLQEWTTHDIIMELKYDSADPKAESNRFRPQFTLFGKLPFNGKNSFQTTLIGVNLAFSF